MILSKKLIAGLILVGLALLTLTDSVLACGRCGLFGRRCRFVASSYSYPVQYTYPQPQIVTINNVFPVPANGNTVYTNPQTYQQFAVGETLNPNELMRQAERLALRGLDTFQSVAVETTSSFRAVEALRAASALVERSSVTSTGQSLFQRTPTTTGEMTSPSMPQLQSILASKCASCHSGATPKGGLTLTGLEKLSCDIAVKVREVVSSGKMPPETPLSEQERMILGLEIYTLLQDEGIEQ